MADQLIVKIQETQAKWQASDITASTARMAYYKSLDTAYELFAAFHNAEHELLVFLLQQARQTEEKVADKPVDVPVVDVVKPEP